MKDRQTQAAPPPNQIPFISTVLHCVSMTVAVFLRRSFGYAYLRPRSLFFAFIWAFGLFTIYAWNEKTVWPTYGSICIFGILASALYLIHLALAFTSEFRRKGEHDHYSGTPNLRLLRQASTQEGQALVWKLWLEPTVVILTATVLSAIQGRSPLSTWLYWAGFSLFAKELLNYWSLLRQQKRQADALDDAGETFETMLPESEAAAPKATRTSKTLRTRSTPTSPHE